MKSLLKDEKELQINSNKANSPTQALYWYLDAQRRTAEAIDENPKFKSDQHQKDVQAVHDILNRYFGMVINFYQNHRPGGNGHEPFTAIKPTNDYESLPVEQRRAILDDLKKIGAVPKVTSLKGKFVLLVEVPLKGLKK